MKVLGWESANGRRYDPAGVDPAMYEGARVYIDHAGYGDDDAPVRSVRELAGVLINVTKDSAGLWADCSCNPETEGGRSLLWWAKNHPHVVGFSHDADIESRPDADGIECVTRVGRVNSVDVVTRPATTRGVYESADHYRGARIEKVDAVQVGYGAVGRKGSTDRTRKQAGYILTEPGGYERFFDTLRAARQWADDNLDAQESSAPNKTGSGCHDDKTGHPAPCGKGAEPPIHKPLAAAADAASDIRGDIAKKVAAATTPEDKLNALSMVDVFVLDPINNDRAAMNAMQSAGFPPIHNEYVRGIHKDILAARKDPANRERHAAHAEGMAAAMKDLAGALRHLGKDTAAGFYEEHGAALAGQVAAMIRAGDGPKGAEPAEAPPNHPLRTNPGGILAKLGSAGKWIKAKTAAVFNKLESRYGRKTAIAIFVAGHAVGLATPLVVLPGSTLIGMAPFAALAEAAKQAGRAVKALTGREAEELDPGAIKSLGERIAKHLSTVWAKRPEPTKEVMDPDTDIDMDTDPTTPPVDAPAAPAPAGDAATHLGNLVTAIMNDASLDAATKRKRILLALKLQDDGGEVTEDEDEGEPDEEDEPKKAFESLKRSKSRGVRALAAELDARRVRESQRAKRSQGKRLCEEAGLPSEAVTATFLDLLAREKDATSMQRLIEDRRVVATGDRKPKSSGSAAADVTLDQFINSVLGV